MKKTVMRHWYLLSGITETTGNGPTVGSAIHFVVESASAKDVLKHYGGTRTFHFPDGQSLRIHFPEKVSEVAPLTKTRKWEWNREQGEEIPATFVIPVTRYVCTCGRVHESEYPYPSVWCACGNKVYPEHPIDVPITPLHRHHSRQGVHDVHDNPDLHRQHL